MEIKVRQFSDGPISQSKGGGTRGGLQSHVRGTQVSDNV